MPRFSFFSLLSLSLFNSDCFSLFLSFIGHNNRRKKEYFLSVVSVNVSFMFLFCILFCCILGIKYEAERKEFFFILFL